MSDSLQTYPPYSRAGTLFHILASLFSILVVVLGGIMGFTKIEGASAKIPDLVTTMNSQALEIAVLKEQQKDLDRKYGEILLQLSRLDAKLDKQNEYLFNSLQHISHNQKESN